MSENPKKRKQDTLLMALLSWIHIVLLLSGVYLVAAAVLRMTPVQAEKYLASGTALLVPAALSWFLVRRIRALWLYILAAVPVCLLYYYAFGFSVTLFLCVLIFLLRCSGWIREDAETSGAEEPRPIHWLVFGLVYLLALVTGAYYQLPWIRALLTAEIFVCLIFSYLRRIDAYIALKQRLANLPADRIRKVGRLILVMLVFLLALLVLPALLCRQEPLIGLAEHFRNMHFEVPMNTAPEEIWQGGDMPREFPGGLAGEAKEPGIFVRVVFRILTAVSLAAGILLTVFLLYAWWKHVSEQFSRQGDEIVFLSEEVREEAGISRLRRRNRKERRGSPNQRIRRLYKKILKKRLPALPGGWETPEELEHEAQLEADEETRQLHELYERARYSKSGCTAMEAESIRRSNGSM